MSGQDRARAELRSERYDALFVILRVQSTELNRFFWKTPTAKQGGPIFNQIGLNLDA